MELKDALRRFRQDAGLKQEDVAVGIGIMRQAYQPYETGKVTPSASMIIKIATTFNVSADYLLGLSDEPRPKKYDEREVAEAFALRDVFSAMLKRAIVDVSKPKAEPNAATLTAISEVECGEGLSREFTSVDDLMKDLMSDA